jgi:hypothetical protein
MDVSEHPSTETPTPSTDLASVVPRVTAKPAPLSTAANCRATYQLRWSLALFAMAEVPEQEGWLPQLRQVLEPDGIRVLEFAFRAPNVCFFLLTTLGAKPGSGQS